LTALSDITLWFTMGTILLTWLDLGLIFIGIGLLVRQTYKLSSLKAKDYIMAFWVGWSITLLILSLWHFMFRIDWRIFLIVHVIGIIGLFRNRQSIKQFVSKPCSYKLPFAIAMILTAILLSNRAILPPRVGDSGLYHLSAIQWATTYPLVAGLANFSIPLGFNCPYFWYVSMLDVGFWTHRSTHIANGILLLVLFGQIYISVFKLAYRSFQPHVKYYHFFLFLFLIPTVQSVFDVNFSSPTNDFPIFIIGIVFASEFLYFLLSFKHPTAEMEYLIVCSVLLALTGIIIKLVFVVIGATTIGIMLSMYFMALESVQMKKLPLWLVSIIGIILGQWLIGNIMLSGYALFPSTFIAFPVAWQTPPDLLTEYMLSTRAWAKTQTVDWEIVLSNSDWFIPWLKKNIRKFELMIPVTLTTIFLLMTCYTILIKILSKEFSLKSFARQLQGIAPTCEKYWLFFLPQIFSLILWFIIAPNLRYVGASLWVFSIGCNIIFLHMLHNGNVQYSLKVEHVQYFFVILTTILSIWSVLPQTIILAGEDDGFYPTKKVELTSFATNSGLMLYVPCDDKNSCWDAPLLCTSYPQVGLQLREPHNLAKGFVIRYEY